MGLQPGEKVQYGRSYKRAEPLNLDAARMIDERAR